MATILIIDDEESVRTLLRFALEAAGYEIVEAANGRIGLERYRHRQADLVITDIAMHELNGLDMMLELTREFLHTKVIAISGVGGEQNVLDAAKLLGHGRPSRSPLACRSCCVPCPTNWTISAAVGGAEAVQVSGYAEAANLQSTLSNPSFKALSSRLMLQRSRIAVKTCTPSFVGLTHRVKRRQYLRHSEPGGPELNSPRSGNVLNHKQHRYVSSPSQTDPPSLLG